MTFAFFPLIPGGKLPAVEAWQHTAPGVFAPVGNYAINLTPTDLVVDADPRNYPEGRDVLAELLSAHQMPQTRTVRTPGGGWHMYFHKPPNLRLKIKQRLYPGIDFKSYIGYVVGPGSVTDKGEYKLFYDVPIQEVPASLLACLDEQTDALVEGSEVSLTMYHQFKAEVEIHEPAIQGKHGDDHTYQLALRGRDLGLPRDVTYRVMRDFWNFRCIPPWGEEDLFKKVTYAYKYAKNALGAKSPEAKFLAETQDTANVISIDQYQDQLVSRGLLADQLYLDKRGNLLNTQANIAYVLRHDPAWAGRIRFNEFSNAAEFVGRPDWRKDQMNEGVELTKRDLAAMQVWFSSAGHVRLEVAEDKLKNAILAAGTPYHPVKIYLDSLKWDGVPRLDRILVDTAGVEDTEYTRTVGLCVMLSAVKRIYEPGCKQDYVMILESKQGQKKSMWIATLGGEWYSANDLVRGDKDTYQNLRGRWFVELPEINATFTKADFNWLKGVITAATDVYRASYGHTSRGVPRESIFIATINPNASKEYLKDDENRRYWPITCGRFEIEYLKKYRDQYFAEAVQRYKNGEANWIVDPRINEMAKHQQSLRRERDPWCDVLEVWVNQHAAGFKPIEVYSALGFSGSAIASHHRQRLYAALRDLGCEYRREFGNGGLWLGPGFSKLL